jgi:hypothetical protein
MPEIAREEADGALSLLGLVSAGFGVALVPETFQQILPVAEEEREGVSQQILTEQ